MLANAQRETLIGRLRHGAACLLLALHGERQAAFHSEILEKEVAIERDEGEAITAVRQLEEKERGRYRPTGAADPDAAIRNHGKEKQDNGYNVSLAATTDFIWAIQAAAGSRPDAMGIVPLLEAQGEHHDHWPEKLIYDRAAGDGQTIAAVHEAGQGKTQLVTDPVQHMHSRPATRSLV